MLTGWCKETVTTRLHILCRVPHSGNWRQSTTVRLQVRTASITWSMQHSGEDDLVLTSPVPIGMVNLFQKPDETQNRTFMALPNSVKEHFDLKKETYKPADLKHTVTFSGLFS